jgi:hypothetical protein
MGTDHVFMKGAKRRPEKRGLSPIFPCPLFFLLPNDCNGAQRQLRPTTKGSGLIALVMPHV